MQSERAYASVGPEPGLSGLGTGLVENWAQPQDVPLSHMQSQQVQ